MHADVHNVLHDVTQTGHFNVVYMQLSLITTIKQVPYALAYGPCLCPLYSGQMLTLVNSTAVVHRPGNGACP